LRPAGSQLVLNQMLFGKNRDRLIGKFGRQPVRPSLIEFDAVNGG
jgi:hypothetical protein